MSSSDNLSDGGFSPSTDAVNLIAEPGIMYSPAQPTDKSTNVVGSIIASSEDPQFLGADRVFVDTGGHYYTWNGTTMTLARTDGTNPTGYSSGKTDMNAFDGSVFTTTNTTLVKWIVDSVFTDNFVTGLNTNVPHPLLTFRGFQFIGDGNLLKRMNDASDSTLDTILILPTLQNIVALGIDPGSGQILISTTQGLNVSDTRSNSNKVLYYDGSSPQPIKTVNVDEMITAFYPVASFMYIGYGQNLGYWNGSGIQFLRRLNIPFSNDSLLYKQHFTNIGTTLYCIENTQILAHGPINSGGNREFYYAYKNNVNSNSLLHIAAIGQNILSMAFATSKFYTWSTTSVATTNTQTFYSNETEFDDEYWLYRVRIIYRNQVNNNVDPGSIRFLDQDGIISIGSNTLLDLKNTSGAASAYKDILNINVKIKQIQTELLLDTVNPGIRRIIGYGDIANKP